jgi:hypothetical protein
MEEFSKNKKAPEFLLPGLFLSKIDFSLQSKWKVSLGKSGPRSPSPIMILTSPWPGDDLS